MAAPAEVAPPEEMPPEEPRREPEKEPANPDRKPWLERAGVVVVFSLVSAFVGSALGTTDLVFQLFPGLRPDPRERAEAVVTVLTVDESVTQRAHFRRLGGPPAGCKREQLGRRGNVYYVRVDVAGFRRDTVGVKWFTYEVGGRRAASVRSNRLETTAFQARASINRQVAQIWVPWPLRAGDFFVRFELYAGGALRAFADTKPFSVPPPLPGQYDGPWCKLLKAVPAG
jgi:hypothetical protein